MYNKKLCHKFGLQAEKGKLAIHLIPGILCSKESVAQMPYRNAVVDELFQ